MIWVKKWENGGGVLFAQACVKFVQFVPLELWDFNSHLLVLLKVSKLALTNF